ncbi:MAG: hypothetical protein E4H08_08220 [Candidatus Atribacteria bacterium]|nr:MAG: hypothetical protein E4H08_08220 [Candidatus Atribacteria bacterium]
MRQWIQSARGRQQSYVLILALIILLGTQMVAWGEPTVLSITEGWSLAPDAVQGRPPTQPGVLEIRGLGELTFDPAAMTTLRPDIFVPGHFSVFDVLVYLSETEGFELDYSFDEELQTHVIHSLSGLSGWWYDAHYEGGGFDKTVVRMDQFPVKDGMSILLYLEDPARLDAITEHFKEEATRSADIGGEIILPLVTLQSSTVAAEFRDVVVTAHNARLDVFQPGTVTMLDVLLSLGEAGVLTELGLDWRDSDGDIVVVDGYYVVSIQAEGFSPETTGSCVLTHQIQGGTIGAFLSPHSHTMSHIHLTADLEVLVSPEAVEWLWICL